MSELKLKRIIALMSCIIFFLISAWCWTAYRTEAEDKEQARLSEEQNMSVRIQLCYFNLKPLIKAHQEADQEHFIQYFLSLYEQAGALQAAMRHTDLWEQYPNAYAWLDTFCNTVRKEISWSVKDPLPKILETYLDYLSEYKNKQLIDQLDALEAKLSTT